MMLSHTPHWGEAYFGMTFVFLGLLKRTYESFAIVIIIVRVQFIHGSAMEREI